jgi:hypothetical protein
MIRRGTRTIVALACLAATLSAFGDRMLAAEKAPSRFQAFSQAHGVRFIGPYAAGTSLSIASLTVAAPFHTTNVGLRLLHGPAAACGEMEVGDAQTFVAVAQGDTVHLTFPALLVVTHATDTWCLGIEQLASEFSQVTIVGFSN